jgi:aspartate beta-hydroxylase
MASTTSAVDEVAQSLIAFLRHEGAAAASHAGGQTLLDHLIGTYEIVGRWGQAVGLQHAALAHSIYGTDAYRQQLVPLSRRHEVAAIVGAEAERLSFLFSVTPRGPLLAGTYRWAPGIPLHDGAEGEAPPTREELDSLVLLHMANLADQAGAPDGSPGIWLVKLGEFAELLADSDAARLPPVFPKLAEMSAADERLARQAYQAGVSRGDDPERRASRLAVSAVCAVSPEPCVWLAYLAACRHDTVAAAAWGGQARTRLRELGTAWDKRLSYAEWSELTDTLGSAKPTADDVTHPRALLEAVRGSGRPRSPDTQPDADGARARFRRYVERLAEAGRTESLVGVYPDLPSQPWHEPARFAVARSFEDRHTEIRDEVLGLDPTRFQPESERIQRAGDWDVVFLYERGRPHDEVLAQCPVTARAIESPEVMRAPGGLIYVSRMRAGTHIRPHRGPTNLRVRCHLGIQVPDGDCAIRVGEEARTWREGRCLVFDDHFEHEAWNRTSEDRTVLIVDLWHPALTPTEVSLVAGLQEQLYAYARRLGGYWSTNERAAESPER